MSPKCSVEGCERAAAVKVLLYDVYPDGEVFMEQDRTCPWLCRAHLVANERGASIMVCADRPARMARDPIFTLAELAAMKIEMRPTSHREARGVLVYPHSNKEEAQGFTIYEPLAERG
jgi:hypothetical protein